VIRVGAVDCGKVDYTSYYGDVEVKRKGGSIKFANAKNYDEEFALKEKQGLQDGDRIATGRKSFITIMGQPEDGKTQIVCVFPDSEFSIGIREWKSSAKGEERRGAEISKLSFASGAFYVMPACAKIEIPLAQLNHIDKKREMKFLVDISQGMTVVLPGSRMEVRGNGGKPHETWPSYGSLGMTELIVTSSGMYEKSMEVDERASILASAMLQFGFAMPQDLKYDEGMMEYSARKTAEGKKKTEEAMKQMLSEEDLEKMKKSGKVSGAQFELARSMAKAMKASGDASSPAFGINMLANMDFSKMKDMPGLTAEQKKQLEEGLPQMMKMQQEFASGGKLAQLTAQANLSEKYVALAASDPVAKKGMAKYKSDFKEKLDSFSLPPYPKPDEKFRVK